jgi:hypothetical protein
MQVKAEAKESSRPSQSFEGNQIEPSVAYGMAEKIAPPGWGSFLIRAWAQNECHGDQKVVLVKGSGFRGRVAPPRPVW